MGIYGALSTAVTGLQAQAFALENISGNIANSQTIGYKRVETSFQDMIPDGKPSTQTAGSVVATARATNNVQGDVSASQTATNMAINGNGFFVVQQKAGESDGVSTFTGATYYTRRGDFDLDKEGHLVNGAGYYLQGLPINPATGNVSGSVPSLVQVSNALLAALPTTTINYQLNLPDSPTTSAALPGVKGSELLRPGDFIPPTAPAKVNGTISGLQLTDPASNLGTVGERLTVTIAGTTKTFELTSGGLPAAGNTAIDISAGQTIADVLATINTELQTANPTATMSLDPLGHAQLTLGADLSKTIAITDTTGLGFGTQGATPTATGTVSTVKGKDAENFIGQSVEGGAITVYSPNGSPADVQFRWAKTDSADLGPGHIDSWNLFYLTNSNAGATEAAWKNVGQNYAFDSTGNLAPPVTETSLTGIVVNGMPLGDIKLAHGDKGITQSFTDTSGTASVTKLTQNGYAAGKFTSVAVNDSGRVIASYSNGQQLAVAQVVTANFNGANALKRLNGGAFAETAESGSPVLSINPSISGSSLESSNTDISSEFSTLIVTQQAYAAGTKIVTTANDMMQQALNMIR